MQSQLQIVHNEESGFALAGTLPGCAVPFAADARTWLLGVIRCADVAGVAISAVLAYWVREGSVALEHQHWYQIVIACVLTANSLEFAGVYSFPSLRQHSSHLGRIAAAWAISMLVVIATMYFAKMAQDFSRAWVLLWGSGGLCGLIAVRLLAWLWLASEHVRGRIVLNVAIVGEGAAAKRLARRMEAGGDCDVRVVGVFRPTNSEQAASAGVPDLDSLVQFARRVRIDEIAISVPCHYVPDFGTVLRRLATVPADVKLCPDLYDAELSGLSTVSVPSARILKRPLSGWGAVFKRSMDLVFSVTLLVVLAPLMLAIAAFIRVDSSGPIFFRQQRFGFNRNPITVHKFRTMHVEAALDPSVPQARRNDPRVTRFGRFLRRTSLDELPQLFDVLNGSMSLVGPRPHAIAHDQKYAALVDGYLGRHRVKPGITGWAQVKGFRGETDTVEKMVRRIEHDLFYINHWSPLFDVYILLLTLFVGFRHRNAY